MFISVSLPFWQSLERGKKEKVVLEAVNGLVSEGKWVRDSSFSSSKGKKKNSRVVFWG